MRFIHTADWHLGIELHGHDRGPEHDVFLDWLAGLIRARGVDALIVAGDVYDSGNPPVAAQARLFRFLGEVLAGNPALSVVLVGGNHDSAARLELPRALLESGRCRIVGAMRREGQALAAAEALVMLPGEGGGAVCAAVPFLRPADLGPAGPEEDGTGRVAALYAALARAAAAAAPGLPLIMTGHLHVAGGAVSEMSERRVLVGGQEAVPASVFPAAASYVALGHLHRPQGLAGGTIRYSGAPLPLSAAEREYRHSVALVEIGADGRATTELIETPRPVAMLRVPPAGVIGLDRLEAELAALELPAGGIGPAFLEVAVRLEAPEPGLRARVEAALAGRAVRLLRVERVSEGGDGSLPEAAAAGIVLGDLSPEEVFVRRHREEFDAPPAEEMLAAFRALLAGLEP